MKLVNIEVEKVTPCNGYIKPYLQVIGTMRFSIDPKSHYGNSIADLEFAPVDEDGLIKFWSDFEMIAPLSSQHSNRNLLVDIPNRGEKTLPYIFSKTETTAPFDSFLIRDGWTILWFGWQGDVINKNDRICLSPPFTSVRLPGQTVHTFSVSQVTNQIRLAEYDHHVYVADPFNVMDARLFVKQNINDPGQMIPKSKWRFTNFTNRSNSYDSIWLEDSFRPNRVYQVIYHPIHCPVIGTGLIAIREGVSEIRYRGINTEIYQVESFEHCFGFGVSQSGRFLRHFLDLGFNSNETGLKVFDGVLVHGAGARKGEFNHRYAQPSQYLHHSFGHLPPFLDAEILNKNKNASPKAIYINTSTEYWFADAGLTHLTKNADERNFRHYAIAGSQHSIGLFPPTTSLSDGFKTSNPINPMDYRPVIRCLFIQLFNWVQRGQLPPPSDRPSFNENTGQTRSKIWEILNSITDLDLHLPDLESFPKTHRFSLSRRYIDQYPVVPQGSYYSVVSSLDKCLNEISGIKLPDVSVPLGTYTGWNAQERENDVSSIAVSVGSFLPLNKDQSVFDPRPTIPELYRTRQQYIDLVVLKLKELVEARHILEYEISELVERAQDRYDYFVY